MRIVGVCFFLIFILSVSAQSALEEAVKEYPDSIALYAKLAIKNLNSKPEDSYSYIIDGLKKTSSVKDRKELARLNSLLGAWHSYHGDKDSAVFYFLKSKALFEEINEAEGRADIANNIGYHYFKMTRYKEAIPYILEASVFYDSLGVQIKYAGSLSLLGAVYQKNKQLDKALEKYRQADDVLGEEMSPKKIQNSGNLATIYNEKGLYDSAILALEKVGTYAKEINDFRSLASSYHNLSLSYQGLNQLSKALENGEKALDYYRQLNDSTGMVISFSNLSEFAVLLNRPKVAISYGLQGLVINEKIKAPESHMEVLERLAQAYFANGEFKKSSEYYREHGTFKDSLEEVRSKSEIAELMEKYEASQRKQEILALQMEKKEANLIVQKSQNQRNILLLTSALVVLLAVFLFILFWSKSKANKIISKSLGEKETLLKEIHHRVKNNLQVISSLLNVQSRFIKNERALAAVADGQSRVESMALIHQMLYQENNLSGVKVKEYVEELAETLRQSYSIETDVIFSYYIDDLTIDIDTIIPIGLILNELICNALKYAFPTQEEGLVGIRLQKEGKELMLEVSDNGVGMENTSSNDSFGMVLINDLAKKLHATVGIKQLNGTTVLIAIQNFKLI